MLKLFVKALSLIAGLALSGAVFAVGMGGINVITALGEPLRAEIDLASVGKIEKGGLTASLASPDAFKGAGMDYPANLPKLKFKIETRANGGKYLEVTSAQPVNEPFVSLLIELGWPSGRLLREYTFLLDPPGYKPEQPKAAEVEPVQPAVAERQYQRGPEGGVGNEPAPMRATAPMDEKVFAAAAARKSAAGSNVASGTIKVKHGDTLSQIARETKSSDISLERMLVALYRANADAFDGKNMNRLRAGKILRMPEQTDLDRLSQVDAMKEVHMQVADWHAYRQKLAAASVRAGEQESRQETSGKISTTVAEKTPAAKEPSTEVVRLSKGEAPGDKTAVAGNTKGLQDKIHALEEEAIAKGKALKESNERVAMLEKNIKEMQHLLELKGQPAVTKPEVKAEPAKVEPAKVEAKPATPASAVPAAAPGTTAKPAAPAEKPAKPAKKPVVAAPKVVTPPPSMMDDPLFMVGGVAALLALGGLGFVMARRRKGGKTDKKAPEKTKVGEDTGTRISAPIMPSPETGDFTQTASAAPISQPQTEDVDPISEADLFLNFGRDVQAEEILKDALEKDPANNQIRLKLLSIYANRKDINSFSSIARQVQDSGDAAAWAQAAGMGRSLEPNNPMYGGADDEIASVGQDQNEQQPAAGLDFDLGFGAPEAAAPGSESGEVSSALLEQDTGTPVMDFDLGIGELGTAAATGTEGTAAFNEPLGEDTGIMQDTGLQASTMDFDITAVHPSLAAGENAAAAPETDDLVFDITSSHPSMEMGAGSKAADIPASSDVAPDMDDLVFDITSSSPSLTATTEEKAIDIPVSEDSGMEFTLDFPVDEKPDASAAQAAATQAVDNDLTDISLDLDEPAQSAPAGDVKDAHWHDVATKLDLAKAYQEMGDNAGAREILEEVLAEGDEQQRATAEATIQQLLA